jgi:uncharacterized protein YecT (DUF1311 family)
MLTSCRAFVFLLFLAATRLLGQSNDSSSARTLAVPPFSRTSFDCAKARVLSVEEAICKNDSLAKLDVEMAEAYRERLRLAGGPEREEAIVSQRRWLTIRNAHNVNPYHGDPPGELADLSDFYKARIAALRSRDLALLKIHAQGRNLRGRPGWLLPAHRPGGIRKSKVALIATIPAVRRLVPWRCCSAAYCSLPLSGPESRVVGGLVACLTASAARPNMDDVSRGSACVDVWGGNRKINFKIKGNGGGQECPPHIYFALAPVVFAGAFCWRRNCCAAFASIGCEK